MMGSSEITRYWLWLDMVFGPGNAKKMELIHNYDSLRELYCVLHDPDCSLLTDKEKMNLRRASLTQCDEIMAYCEKNGIGIMTWESAMYPESLRHIYDPPTVLFYRGNPVLLHENLLLTVVGTRRPSQYSLRVGNWLCRDLARCNLILVSGCAVGLDSCAHAAAIAEGKPTIAVLGCGIDYDYPKENRALKEKIVENGLLLSEYFPGTPPRPGHFPVRNRILSGISKAVLVVEAGRRSGSLITANLACEQEKYVFCVPPADLFDPRYSGVAGFLRDGAYPVFSYLDILYVYYMQYPHKLTVFDEEQVSRTEDSLLFTADSPEKRSPRRRTAAASGAMQKGEPQELPSAPKLTSSQQMIVDILKKGGQSIDALCMKTGMGFEDISMLVMELEMLNIIENSERNVFVLSGDGPGTS